ncbi:hypothetical protein FQN52_002230 [Onygenales sp. PD_12]|nr:hypothetical protein FQN52_002230 [Onygenales sp. PD_12]
MSQSAIPSLLHLHPLAPSSIPAHPALPFPFPVSKEGETPDTRPSLPPFIHSALTQAHSFVTSTVPKEFTPDPKRRTSPPSTATVKLLSGTLRQTPLHPASLASKNKEDKWFARCSVHDDRPAKGTASYEEFVRLLKDDHLSNELEYAPTMSSVDEIAKWDCDAMEIEGGWSGMTASVALITHTFQPTALISPRAFLVMIISAFLPSPSSTPTQSDGFITIQLPIHQTLPSHVPRGVIFANYISVEHVRVLPQEGKASAAGDDNAPRKIEWTMATSSDSGGLIPGFLQEKGVAKAVVKDVGLFMKWVEEKRSKG